VSHSFIFAADTIGRRFMNAGGATTRRRRPGVGGRRRRPYSWPPIHRVLRQAGIPVARFLPITTGPGIAFFDLRNHRKILVADGHVAFCGGMNIRDRHVVGSGSRWATRDVHFRLEGPVVAQLLEAFIEDWAFVTREVLDGPAWFPPLVDAGPTAARVLTGGPDDDFEVTRTVLLGALSAATRTVSIVTPYFLPDQAMIAALAVAALRGVRVDIVLPARGNIPLVRWATPAMLWQVLGPGCRVFLSPAPFDHAKLFVVDRAWTMFGSTNWDPRSLRLNFELDGSATTRRSRRWWTTSSRAPWRQPADHAGRGRWPPAGGAAARRVARLFAPTSERRTLDPARMARRRDAPSYPDPRRQASMERRTFVRQGAVAAAALALPGLLADLSTARAA
jgi:cardiolipin synthase